MYTRVQRNGKKPADSTTNQLASRPFKVESRPQDDANENTVVQNKELPSYKKSCLLTNIEILPPGGYQQPLQPKLEIQPQTLDARDSNEPQGVKSGGDFLTINRDVIQNKEQPTDLNTQTDNSWVLGITRGASSKPPAPPLGIQTKLTIGQPGDKYEQEADRVAADVVQKINAPQSENVPAQLQTKEQQEDRIQRDIAPMIPKFSIFPPGVSSPPPPAIQMKLSIREPGEVREPTFDQPIYTPVQPMIQCVNIGEMAASPDVEAGIQRARGGGQPLAESIREPMEQAFGADFRGVRVHTDAQADQLNQSIQAKAFTTGQDVFFRQGAYEPGSRGGQELLAHELTHVGQQKPGVVMQAKLDQDQKEHTEEAIQKQETKNINKTGLPDALKAGVENLSGYSLDDVRVHYNSSKPAQLQALAYTQGTDIHIAPRQEKHLPHEAWHVVQQMQGRVKPTMQMKGVQVNDDEGLEREADVMGDKAFHQALSGQLCREIPKKFVLRNASQTVQSLKGRKRSFDETDQSKSAEEEKGVSEDLDVTMETEVSEQSPPVEILNELNDVIVNVSRHFVSRRDKDTDPTTSVKLNDYFLNPKQYSGLSVHALIQEIHLEYVMELTKPDQNPDRLTALHWALEELTFPVKTKSGGGGGNLKVSYDAEKKVVVVSGRPGFEESAQSLPGMRSGFHRRHIIAWHTLKAAVTNVINQLIKLQDKDSGIKQATTILLKFCDSAQDKAAPSPPKKPRKNKKEQKKVPSQLSKNLEDWVSPREDWVSPLERVLSKINSNVLNLWPGDGYENSLINTYQGLFRNWSKEVIALDEKDANQWVNKKADELESRLGQKKGKYKRVLEQFVVLLRAWKPDEKGGNAGIQLSRFLHNCADNFEVDFPFSPDRANFDPSHVISASILAMAGTLLNWAEGDMETFKGKKASELGVDLENFLHNFLSPSSDSKIGRSESEKTPDKSSQQRQGKAVTKSGTLASLDKPQKIDWSSVPNIGNSCYIASVMNMILSLTPYKNLFLENRQEEIYDGKVFEVLNTGRDLLKAMNEGRGTAELVTNFRKALIKAGWLGGNIGMAGTQQDAGELLTFLFDLLKNTTKINREHRWRDRGSPIIHTAPEQENMLLLGGLHPGGDERSLEDLLTESLDRNHFDPEQVDAGTIREHNWRLAEVPDLLTIQLNRFQYSPLLGGLFKLKEKLQAQQILALPGTLTPDNTPVNYRLTSFILHEGETTQAGHYYSYQRRGDQWLLVNDADVYQVTNEEVNEQVKNAYIIAYEKMP